MITPKRKISVVLADDHPIVRDGLRMLLNSAPDILVVGEAGDGREAVQQALKLKPEVVLMDLAMPLLNGIEATRQIMQQAPLVKVLILSTYRDEERVEAALDAGAAGYLVKETVSEDLLEAIRFAGTGRPCFSPTILQGLLKRWQEWSPNGTRGGSRFEKLSCRQAEVLQLIAEGFGSGEMAEILRVSEKTIQKHRQSLMDKLNIHEISGLTRYAFSTGVIELNGPPLLRKAFIPRIPSQHSSGEGLGQTASVL
jgi:DNA-binding NarL/FixJ family response regulator